MTYKIDKKNLNGNYTLSNLILFVGFVFLVVIGLSIIPQKVKESLYTEKIVAESATRHSKSNSDGDTSYYIKYIYYVNEVEYEYNTNGVSKDDKYDNNLFCRENSPSFCISTVEIRQANDRMWLLFMPGVILLVAFIIRLVNFHKVLKVKKLCNKGVLVKNIPYRLVPTNLEVNGKKVMAYLVTFTFPDGVSRELISNGIYKDVDETGWCDMLFNPNDYSNYYIDKSIRVTGHGNPVIIHYQQQ